MAERLDGLKFSKDPLCVEKVYDVIGLYLNPPETAVVFCVNEKSKIQALEDSHPVLPMMSGMPEKRTHDKLLGGAGSSPLLVIVVGIGGPASMIGFDFGRTFNPERRMGSAIGIINQGGFVASLLLVIAIGYILDWRTPGSGANYPPSAFRWAMSAQYVLWGLGFIQIWRYRLKTRARILKEDPDAKAKMTKLG